MLGPGYLPFQRTFFTAAPLIFARTLPYSGIFRGSPLSTRLSLMTILSFCDLATTTSLSFSSIHCSAKIDVWIAQTCLAFSHSCCFLCLEFLSMPSQSIEIPPSLQGPAQMHPLRCRSNLTNLVGNSLTLLIHTPLFLPLLVSRFIEVKFTCFKI